MDKWGGTDLESLRVEMQAMRLLLKRLVKAQEPKPCTCGNDKPKKRRK